MSTTLNSDWMQELVDEITAANGDDPFLGVLLADALKRHCPFKPNIAYREVTSDFFDLQRILADANMRYSTLANEHYIRYVVQGQRDVSNAQAGTAIFVFEGMSGKLIAVKGLNEVIPPMKTWWERWRWIFRG